MNLCYQSNLIIEFKDIIATRLIVEVHIRDCLKNYYDIMVYNLSKITVASSSHLKRGVVVHVMQGEYLFFRESTKPSAEIYFFYKIEFQEFTKNLLISENLDLLFIMLLCIVVKEQYPGSRLIFRSYIFLFELNLQNFLQTYEIKSFVNTFDQTKVFEHHKINIFINFYR